MLLAAMASVSWFIKIPAAADEVRGSSNTDYWQGRMPILDKENNSLPDRHHFFIKSPSRTLQYRA